jgi:hypothetical protein
MTVKAIIKYKKFILTKDKEYLNIGKRYKYIE